MEFVARFSPDLVTRAQQVLALREVSEFLDDPAVRKSRPARLPPARAADRLRAAVTLAPWPEREKEGGARWPS